jgi:hypothetical protein
MLGCRFKEMAMSVSWGQLIAASGMIAIAYTNREPAADLNAPRAGRPTICRCSSRVPDRNNSPA